MHRLCLLLLFLSTPLFALEPLVNSVWLVANREMNNLFLLDIQPTKSYRRLHIPGAINAPYTLWRSAKNSETPGMLPSIKQMERFLGELGIGNKSAVVIIATGNQPGDMAASSRVFWTLKVMGHRQVAILNGGVVDYAKRFARDLEDTPRYGIPTRYKSTIDNSITANAADILAVRHSNTQLLDARTLGEYIGVIRLKLDERPGTIPGARHIPFDWFVDELGLIRDKSAAKALFKYAGLDPNRDGTIHFCHTGNRAALSWFVDFAILGNRNARLYDASMSEWAAQKTLPMEMKILWKISQLSMQINTGAPNEIKELR
jgi:thiosulfate/3-mercaptopyruvate sulfurtransferase